jgi:hypothetical protein
MNEESVKDLLKKDVCFADSGAERNEELSCGESSIETLYGLLRKVAV